MPISHAFRRAVESGDKLAVRIMMKNSMYLDPTFREFEEMSRVVERSKLDLYVPYDGGSLGENTAEWTKDYMDTLMVELVDNFSRERVAHLKKVVRYIYHPTDSAQEEEQKQGGQPLSYEERKKKSQADGSYAGAVFGAGIGAAAGCVAGAVGGVIVGHLLAGLAVGAAAGTVIGGWVGYSRGGRN